MNKILGYSFFVSMAIIFIAVVKDELLKYFVSIGFFILTYLIAFIFLEEATISGLLSLVSGILAGYIYSKIYKDLYINIMFLLVALVGVTILAMALTMLIKTQQISFNGNLFNKFNISHLLNEMKEFDELSKNL